MGGGSSKQEKKQGNAGSSEQKTVAVDPNAFDNYAGPAVR
jgi:hypothetical protein